MSTEFPFDAAIPEGSPELTSLGKRLEILRIARGISKQFLARHAGTSRQQLWRVMTGKSELTSSLKERLAGALSVDPAMLTATSASSTSQTFGLTAAVSSALARRSAPTIAAYLADSTHLTATLGSLPEGDAGRRLKRALLNALEDLAVDSAQSLPSDFPEIRRRVLAGEL
jgi:transcriptional regulator with XRE-family HTH domain